MLKIVQVFPLWSSLKELEINYTKHILCSLHTPVNNYKSIKDTAFECKLLFIKNNKLYALIKILDTENGKYLKDIINGDSSNYKFCGAIVVVISMGPNKTIKKTPKLNTIFVDFKC